MTRNHVEAAMARLLADVLVRELRAEMAAAAAVHDASLRVGQGDTASQTGGAEPGHAAGARANRGRPVCRWRRSATDMQSVTQEHVEHARLGVHWLHLLVGLHRARNAADARNERAMRNVLEQLIVLAADEAGRA